ncbi:hypothetical protein [Mucilaginibacter sp. OK098]|uniref:hypothetical protein n=1 Tax=Mucilaginibacter sp. OK098 TaxID=1855297 RepID=UPI00091D2CDF|nr:hypothetical protein [Mucilaginibacter sp. OK098]SHM93194.1 hypothetical protein SAMN05216524_104162 [Mucilaginibacter sp. OK098]
MKNISVQLQQFVKESLHPNTIARQPMTTGEFEKWNDFINAAIAELSRNAFKSAIVTHERGINISELINLLTDLSNTINEYLTKYTKVWQKHSMAARIRQSYLSSCGSLEDILEVLAKRFPKIAAQTAYSHYAIYQVKQELRLLAIAAKQHLQGQSIALNITSIFSDGLNFLINQRYLKRGDNHYIRKLIEAIVKKQFTDPAQVIDFLIANDFNLPDFFLFCLEQWNAILTEQDGLIEQKQKLLDLKGHLYDLSISFGLKSPWDKHCLHNELNKFLSEKYSLVKERLKISRHLLEGEGYRPNSKRMLINLSVAQLGLFLRMQVEKGVLAKEHIGELFAFYARHYYTPNTDFISPESLQKKSSVVEHATARKLKALLISMLNWLNTNYNLSNYN